ncbi:MAG TPA: hypothetical protein PK109_01390 [Candidatus Paceibacterota bacterium]|nr:hypothetical protein [Candidatus Paceibacterota bacterium]
MAALSNVSFVDTEVSLRTDYMDNVVSYAPGSGTPSQNPSGMVSGINVRYLFPVGRFRLGAEAYVLGGHLEDEVDDGFYIDEGTVIDLTYGLDVIAGVVLGSNVLVYAKGGVSYASAKVTKNCPPPVNAHFGYCSTRGPFDHETNVLWQGQNYGAGISVRLGRFNLTGDYQHNDFDALSGVSGQNALGQDVTYNNMALAGDQYGVRIGYNF